MSSEPIRLAVEDVWKTFAFYRHPIHRFTSWLTRGRHGMPRYFEALRGVTFGLPAGTSLAIVGVNGAGKSTLLKIVTGTLEPTRGTVRVAGRIASLLELGTGFHPLFTGRQNISYNARFLGLSNDEIRERLPEIEAFSELGEFLDRPLRTYSSGMYVRLAFAVAASVSPDVLVVDEVLAVGDAYFQQKCMQRIRDFRDRGTTLLFVSHDPGAVKTLCDRAVLLHEGRIIDDDTAAGVLERYNALIARKKAESHYFELEATREGRRARRSGSGEAVIADLELLDDAGRVARALLAGAEAVVRVRVFFFTALEHPTVGILFRDRLGNDVYGTNTFHQHVATGACRPGDLLEVRFRLRLDLGPGEYSVTAAAHSLGVHVFDSYDWLEAGLIFRVLPPDDRAAIGVAHLRPEIEVARVPEPVSPARVITDVFGSLPTAIAMGENGSAYLRTGWHAAEGAGADAFRWTEAESTLLLSLSGTHLFLEAGADRPPGAKPVDVRVLSLEHEIGRLRVEPGATWNRFALPLPADVPRGPTHLRIVVGRCWTPAETGAGDARVLGVRIRRIWSGDAA